MSTAQTGRTHDLHPTASRKPKNPLTRGCRPHMTHNGHLMHTGKLKHVLWAPWCRAEAFDEKIKKDAHLRQAMTPGQI